MISNHAPVVRAFWFCVLFSTISCGEYLLISTKKSSTSSLNCFSSVFWNQLLIFSTMRLWLVFEKAMVSFSVKKSYKNSALGLVWFSVMLFFTFNKQKNYQILRKHMNQQIKDLGLGIQPRLMIPIRHHIQNIS